MNLDTFVTVLEQNPDKALQLVLPGGTSVPAHFHVTEIGHVRKDFVDCGGTTRSSANCVLQVWVADDTEHRLDTTKLAGIVRFGTPLFESTTVPVEIEYEEGVVSQYPVDEVDVTPAGVVLRLAGKHTTCLAKDRCGVEESNLACCSTPGCC